MAQLQFLPNERLSGPEMAQEMPHLSRRRLWSARVTDASITSSRDGRCGSSNSCRLRAPGKLQVCLGLFADRYGVVRAAAAAGAARQCGFINAMLERARRPACGGLISAAAQDERRADCRAEKESSFHLMLVRCPVAVRMLAFPFTSYQWTAKKQAVISHRPADDFSGIPAAITPLTIQAGARRWLIGRARDHRP